jgi:hypothetical protein
VDYAAIDKGDKDLKKGIMKSMGGFKGMFKKKKKEYNYEDFDTDDEEDLDLIPEWLRDRVVYKSSIENCVKMNKNIVRIPIMRGSVRQLANPTITEVCVFKFVIL